ncbi:HAMP domain-containing protein [Dehalococcoides mccartyi]|nr:HAMP domain-containing protein [Dehalococcoides mccartyi]
MGKNLRAQIPWSLPRTQSGSAHDDYTGVPQPSWLSPTRIRSSMRAKLIVVGTGASIIALSIVSLVAFVITKDAIADSVMNGLSAVATNQRQQIDSLFDHYKDELDGISSDTQVRQSLRHLIATGDQVDRFVLNQILSDRVSSSMEKESFDIHDREGNVVASSEAGHIGSNSYDPTNEKVVIDVDSLGIPNQLHEIRMSSPIIFDGRTIGYATVHHVADELNDIVTSYIGQRETGESLVITRDLDGNARFVTSLRFNENGDYYRVISGDDEERIESRSLLFSSGSGTSFTDYRGKRVFGIHHYIEVANIGLVVKIDETEALSRLNGLGWTLAAVIVVVSLVIVIVAVVIARHLIDPISRLTHAADLFSRGELNSRVSIDSTDEIGVLGLTFNVMAERIQSANEDLEARVEERTADLKRSNQDLEQFAYVASHDLQEPLRMVSSYTQLLSKRYSGKLDESADDFIYFAVDGAKRMQVLINDLLTYSRAGRTDTAVENLDVERIATEAISNLGSRIEDSGTVITFGEMPTLVADRQQLVSIFQNLISNSIKYRSVSRDSQIEIQATRISGAWQFSVKDNGIGIDSAFTDRIFTIFQRLHGRDEYQGTGIGLAVVKKLVERSGGSIWVESVLDEGSTFLFTVVDRTLKDDSHKKNGQITGKKNGRNYLRAAS